ncbi:MAG: GntR family transcriptional regulator [Alphaproteobacteria bacterium]|nr:GntR family transcriptional regulator [Alphaproteobacteria bacterium]
MFNSLPLNIQNSAPIPNLGSTIVYSTYCDVYNPPIYCINLGMKHSAQTIVNAIKNDIICGLLTPGRQLTETSLAERFGVSRTPIRESIQALIASGLIERHSDRSLKVVKLNSRKLLEMHSIMTLLDAEAASLAARRASIAQLDRLKAAQLDCIAASKTMDKQNFYIANSKFHQIIRKASGNNFLEQEANKLHSILHLYRGAHFRTRAPISTLEHELIIAAIEKGDQSDARLQMTKHTEIKGDRLFDLIASSGGETEQ